MRALDNRWFGSRVAIFASTTFSWRRRDSDCHTLKEHVRVVCHWLLAWRVGMKLGRRAYGNTKCEACWERQSCTTWQTGEPIPPSKHGAVWSRVNITIRDTMYGHSELSQGVLYRGISFDHTRVSVHRKWPVIYHVMTLHVLASSSVYHALRCLGRSCWN